MLIGHLLTKKLIGRKTKETETDIVNILSDLT